MVLINRSLTFLYTVAFLLLSITKSEATHIRAGEIIASNISTGGLKYSFSMIAYTDTGSPIEFGQGQIDFGDGTVVPLSSIATFSQTLDLGDEVAYNIIEFEHTFRGTGLFTVSYREKDRNAGIVNMSNSVNTPFYVETQILIDPVLNLNKSPVFKVPPIDKAAVGVKFIHNPGADDEEGDSLSYRIVTPKQAPDLDVFDYVLPNDDQFYENPLRGNEAGTGPPSFDIDPITGDLVWDAPGMAGEYNVAFIVDEWRKIEGTYIRIGYITRDMQIIVEESDNQRPDITVPDDICIEAGTLLKDLIIGSDPDGHDVKLEAFGGPLELRSNPAQVSPDPPIFQKTPGTLQFSWPTDCDHVRKRPYEMRFKVTDSPDIGPKLVDFKTWRITVVAPAPTGLAATVQNAGTMHLNWDAYTCGLADRMQIWRRVDSYDFIPDECTVGMPEYAGYQLIATIDDMVYQDDDGNTQFVTSYVDDNNGQGLSPGANYCYRIVAQFPDPKGGESFASAEACNRIKADVPITVNVDVVNTSSTAGEVAVRWYSSYEADPVQFPRPYHYQVLRAEGLEGGSSTEAFATSDTAFIDTGLNTKDNIYRYTIHAFDANNNAIGQSATASTVRLELAPAVNTLELTWSADVPWSNRVQDHPWHYVYRNHVDTFDPDLLMLIDSTDANLNGFKYVDDGSFNNSALLDTEEYCYYVQTKGSYGNPRIVEPLLNRSQAMCGRPNDLIPPCTPVSFRLDESFDCQRYLEGRGCSFSDFENKILWSLDESGGCQDDVRSFNVYYSAFTNGEPELIANVSTTEFVHSGLSSFKGCYRIAAVDRSGNESQLSEMVCNDNCPNFEMPNVFTPNGDQVNDVFTPYIDVINGRRVEGFDVGLCPRFVLAVDFTVFDRNGGPVFNFNSGNRTEGNAGDVLVNWDGKTNSGIELASGVYFYSVKVTFDVLNPGESQRVYNGYVHLLK